MSTFTLHDLQCFDAVVRGGSFQAAAALLHRSHPSVFAAVAKLEKQLDLPLLDRSGYRVAPTLAGKSLHRRAQTLLREMESLRTHAAQLAMGEESELRVVIGGLCPLKQTLGLLSRFFATCPTTRLHLYFEALSGPRERLLDGDADLILHHVDKNDPRVEWFDLCRLAIVPVAAPGFLPFAASRAIRPEQLRDFTQCVIRDTARHSAALNYFIVEGAPQCTVTDQSMKKEMILQGMGWGHLPYHLIERELRSGRLQSIAGRHLPGKTEEIVVARRRDRPHGPVANRLWDYLQEQAPKLRKAFAGGPPKSRKQSG
ncbi:LysR family transcriptional regulator [Rhodanobacter sp. OK091]|uniref:LysR family transcriptional regulator n=1 Tax=Rhodanobacter sp. OK091 TaxID=1881037 RepID=UPI00091C6143|nr:LysR family transcriptional regulator [Rhodanobacter sp. OK091]SHL62268.1 DNA-binding transcriptional regulator, LysR family [Rhodanobacter sp. OK091]